MRSRFFLAIAAAAGAVTACSQDLTGPPGPPEAPSRPALGAAVTQNPFTADRTPFQRSLLASIAERRAQGLPVPASVTFALDERAAPAPDGLMRLEAEDAGTVYEARTVIQFSGPTEAGHDAWPALVVSGSVPEGATGFIRQGDYTDEVRRQIAARYPGANVPVETAPRTYTITETITVPGAQGTPSLLGLTDRDLASLTSSSGLLMGFTIPGPNLDYHIEYNLSVCVVWFFGCWVEWEIVDFWAGFQLDWTVAMRLPMAVSLTSDDAIPEGSTITPTTAATGLDWSAADYAAAGVVPENGNEFVLRFIFKTGVFLYVSYIPVVELGVDVDIDRTASFATPLGAGAMFALPTLNVSVIPGLLDLGVASADFGAALTPLVGSDRYTGAWAASGAGSGSGSVTYTTAGQDVPLGGIHADDGPGSAAVQLSGLQYHFTQFGLDLGLYFSLQVAGWSHTWTIPIAGFDLGGILGGLHANTHAGTPGAVTIAVPVANVAPAVVLSRAGTVSLGGQPTFLVPAGTTLTFTGTATDPGLDDLTLAWDWADGAPSPDVATTYPVPYSVTASQSHAFAAACLYQVTLTAADDDQAQGADHVPVLVTGARTNRGRMEGWWQHQLGRMGATELDEATLTCYLAIAAHMSSVFGEARNVGTIAAAWNVLQMRRNGGNPREQFDRELLVVWLNFAHGAVAYDALVDTNGDQVGDMPFADVVAGAEALRMDPAATADAIRRVTTILHGISVMAAS